MSSANQIDQLQIGQSPQREMIPAQIIEAGKSGVYRLDNGLSARRACSCVLMPDKGDRVLVYPVSGTGCTAYILHVLEREASSNAAISIPGCEELDIQQQRLRLTAAQEIALACAGTISLTSVAGAIQVKARQWVSSILGSIVETARERVSRADFTQFSSSVMTQLQSKQAIIMADEDIKIDAERINLG